MNRLDLAGKKLGRYLVLKETKFKTKSGNIKWECICDCGKVKIVIGRNLTNGNTISCGCYKKEKMSDMMKLIKKTHGLSKTRQYGIWSHMLNRCNSKKNIGYSLYGGRGIKVCDRWLKFENFWEDMKANYSDSLSIDRIDNNGNYEPGNCRWATPEQQQQNKRQSKNGRLITYEGQTKTLMQWAKSLKMRFTTLQMRLNSGWTVEKALNTPVKNYKFRT